MPVSAISVKPSSAGVSHSKGKTGCGYQPYREGLLPLWSQVVRALPYISPLRRGHPLVFPMASYGRPRSSCPLSKPQFDPQALTQRTLAPSPRAKASTIAKKTVTVLDWEETRAERVAGLLPTEFAVSEPARIQLVLPEQLMMDQGRRQKRCLQPALTVHTVWRRLTLEVKMLFS